MELEAADRSRREPANADMVFIAGLPGTGKSTFAPYLAKEIGDAHVFDSDVLFAGVRDSYGKALETNAINEPGWITFVHPALMNTLTALAAGCIAGGRSVVVVSPLGRYVGKAGGMEELTANYAWAKPKVVLAKCDEDVRLHRVSNRGRTMDGRVHDRRMSPMVPTIPHCVVDLTCPLEEYEQLARVVAMSLVDLPSMHKLRREV